MQDIPKDPFLRKEYHEKQLTEAVPLVRAAIEKGFPEKALPTIDNIIAKVGAAWLETLEILCARDGTESGDFLGGDYHLFLTRLGLAWLDPADSKYRPTAVGSFIFNRLEEIKPKPAPGLDQELLTKKFAHAIAEFKSTEEFTGPLRYNPEFCKLVDSYIGLWSRDNRDAFYGLCYREGADQAEPTHHDYSFMVRSGLAFEGMSNGFSPILRPTFKAYEAYHAYFKPEDPEIPNWWAAAGFNVAGPGAPLGAKEMPQVTLKRFTTTKRVWASLIKGAYVVHRVGSEQKHISLEVEDCGDRLPFPHALFENHRDAFLKIKENPQYVVIYENGYVSLCPKAEFEKHSKQF